MVKTTSLLLMLFILHSEAYAKQVFLTTHNLPPYSYYQGSVLTGSAVKTIHCAFSRLDNYSVEIGVMPWKRAQLMVRNNTADGFFAASHNNERDKFAVMSEFIAEQKWTWFLLKENAIDPQSEQFKHSHIVSSFLGANMQAWLEANKYRTLSSPPSSNEQLIKFLMLKRVDAILANDQVMDSLTIKLKFKEKIRSVVNINKPLAVYYSREFTLANPNFMQEFNKAVKYCRHKKSTP